MKDFSNASFPPETIDIMKDALDAAVASLPDPVSSAHGQAIAETILRTAKRSRHTAANGIDRASDFDTLLMAGLPR